MIIFVISKPISYRRNQVKDVPLFQGVLNNLFLFEICWIYRQNTPNKAEKSGANQVRLGGRERDISGPFDTYWRIPQQFGGDETLQMFQRLSKIKRKF